MDEWKRRWGVGQWAAFFETRSLPVMKHSKLLLKAFEEANAGLLEVEARATVAAQVASGWATA